MKSIRINHGRDNPVLEVATAYQLNGARSRADGLLEREPVMVTPYLRRRVLRQRSGGRYRPRPRRSPLHDL